MRNTLLKVGGAFYLTLALLFASCVNKISDEIQKSNIPISFSIKTGKKVTKVVDNAFESGDKLGIFALLSGNSLAQQRYIDNLLLNCGGGSTLIPQKEVFYPEGDVTLDFISYYPYQAEGISKGSLYTVCRCARRPEQSRELQPVQFYDGTNRKSAQ